MGLEKIRMEVEHNKEELSAEERVLKRLLNEWRNVDDRFIPLEQKQLYKETFENYLIVQAHKEVQAIDKVAKNPNPQKTPKKRGRRTLQESIQLVEEMLINTGKIVPLITVFQPTSKVTQ